MLGALLERNAAYLLSHKRYFIHCVCTCPYSIPLLSLFHSTAVPIPFHCHLYSIPLPSLFHSTAVPIPFLCCPYSIPLPSLFHSTAISIPFHCRLYSIPLPSLFQELAQLVPDVNTRTQDLPTYTGNRESTRILQTTKSQLDHMDPPSYGSGLGTPAFDDNWQHNDRSL